MKVNIYDLEINKYGMNVLHKIRTEESNDLNLYDSYDPKPFYSFMNRIFRIDKQSEEHLYILAFDYYYKPVGAFDVAHGSINEAKWKPFNIFTRLSLCNGIYFIMIHNHPFATKESIANINDMDYKATQDVIRAGFLVKRKCIDHIIIGKNSFCSLAIATSVFTDTEEEFKD